MFLGHIGIAFAGKSVEKKLPVWALVVAVMVPDIMSAFFGIIRMNDESVFWSHSLFMTLVFCIVSACILYPIYRRISSVLMFSGLILSHWVCDFISWPLEAAGIYNRITLFSVNSAYGLGLYKNLPRALVFEFSLLALGLGLYIYKRHKD